MPTFGTLFSGGELFGVGAEQAGWTHLWGIEKDDKIAEVARKNGFNVRTGSVTDLHPGAKPVRGSKFRMHNQVTGDVFERPDHLHLSPPCPSFSVAKTNGGETELDIAMAEHSAGSIQWLQPDTVSLENVVGYRSSKSFAIIMDTLHRLGYWTDIQHLNSADFGVPQTRNRLVVRAARNFMLRPYPAPVKWVGWYEAIEDLIPTLPDSEFAPWQIARLPQEYRDFLLGNGTRSEPKYTDQPADTVTANHNQTGVRAFLMAGSGNTNFADAEPGKGVRYEEDPAHTVAAGGGGRVPTAFVLSGDNRSVSEDIRVSDAEDPIFTIKSNAGGKAPVRAFVLNGGNANARSFEPRDETEPHHTVTASMDRTPSRAYLPPGRVVKMTIQALGRFQTVPDTYKGLTTKINGNGVPCKEAEIIMKTFNN